MRKKHRVGMATVALSLLAVAAQAQEVVKGVYLGSPELCAEAKKDTLQKVLEDGNVVLTNRGIEAIEFNCAFLQFLKNPRMPAGWVATSMCEEPGYAYPDVFSVVERQAGELEVAAMTELNSEAGAAPQEDMPPADEQAAPQATAPAPPAPPTAEAPAPEEGNAGDGETEAAGLSGTYYRCEGLSMP